MHPFRTPRLRPVAVLAALALLASCDGRPLSPAVPAVPASPNAKVTVRASKADALMLVRTPSAAPGARGGTTLQLDADVLNPNGKVLEHKQHVYWTSSDTLVATVDGTGLVTALDTGEVQIYVDHKKGVDTIDVVIEPVPVTTVVISGVDSLSLDDTASFTAAALDSVGVPLEGRAVEWTSLAPTIATVDDTGLVVARAVGATEVTAAVDGVEGHQDLTVWPQPVVAVTVEPAAASLPQFRRLAVAGFTATAYDRRGKVLAGRTLSWSFPSTSVAALTPAGDSLVAKDVGTATVTATVEGTTASATVTVTNPVEARVLWVNRLEYTNFNSIDFAKIATIFQKAASANFNVVYFQVRTSGDALYFSDIEPCSPRMCGSLGGPRPSRDPLAVALEEAAKHGIQVHAWLNAYTGFIAGSGTACGQFITSTPANWLKAKPEWSASTKNFTTGAITRQVDNCATTSEYMYVSPGIPEVRAHVARVAADVARRYGPTSTHGANGVKGIHLDRIRYSANNVSYDQPSQEAYRALYGTLPPSNANGNWLNLRRSFVNQGVREIHDSVEAVSPSLVLSAAVWPAYTAATYGWASNAANYSFTDLFQDPHAWAAGGYLDVEVPMIYAASLANNNTSWMIKPGTCAPLAFTCTMDDHIRRIERGTGRHVYVGIGAIRGWAEMNAQVDLAHDRQASGISVYSFSQVDAIANGWAQFAAGPFKHKATIPAMSWK